MDAVDAVVWSTLARVASRTKQSRLEPDQSPVLASPKDGTLHDSVAHCRTIGTLEVRRFAHLQGESVHGRG